MKRSFLDKLRINGIYYIIGALLLVVGVPLYQLTVLLPQGYSDALASAGKSAYLLWLSTHIGQFLGYRALLLLAFVCILSLPFTLFRIIVAQELLGREEEENILAEEEKTEGTSQSAEETNSDNGNGELPPFAWRGKGFAVLAAWFGLAGIFLYLIGTLASSIYLFLISNGFTSHTPLPASFSTISNSLTLLSNTIGWGLLGLACLFFGAIIARSGLKLWPGIWIAFGYMALALGALFSASAIAVSSGSTQGQAALVSPTILLFALWVLWFGIMLVRLKPEA